MTSTGAALLRLEPGAVHHRQPFDWFSWPRVFSAPAVGRALRAQLPAGFDEVRRDEGDKRYRMARRRLWPDGGATGLPPLWRRLVDEVTGPAYRRYLSVIVGRDLTANPEEVVAWRYGPGCHLSPHTDEPTKVFTQILYLNDGWRRGWGGTLRLLGPGGRPAVEVEPTLDRAVGLLRSDVSWHEVAPVTDPAAPDRLSVQVVFHV